MASLKELKKLVKLKERLATSAAQNPEAPTPTQTRAEDCKSEVLAALVTAGRVMHRSVASASQHADNAEHLLQVLKSQPQALEQILRQYGYSLHSSDPGSEYDPETQEADGQYVPTDNAGLEGHIALSVSPAYYNAKGELAGLEVVRLYEYQPSEQ